MSNTSAALASAPEQVGSGERFGFGRNWQKFLSLLTGERIAEAERSLREMLALEDLKGKTFLDVGNGSGLFSLAAMRLGAARVYSFDFDPQSIACAQELKRRYFDGDAGWTIQQGSVLDQEFLESLGQFDVVYSWGVLHHTGNMWQALENVSSLVAESGQLFIALYNDQGVLSRAWNRIKRLYNSGPGWRLLIIPSFAACLAVLFFLKDVFFLHRSPLRRYREFQKSRGMAFTTDLLDWLGGYPFEVARVDAVFDFYRRHGFELTRLRTAGAGWGNNEFVFVRARAQAAS